MNSTDISMQLKLQFWETVKSGLIAEFEVFEAEFKDFLITKNPKNLRQRNIQNHFDQAEKLILDLSQFRLRIDEIEKIAKTRHSKIGAWSIFRMRKLMDLPQRPKNLPVLMAPKDQFVFRFPFSVSILNSESFSTYFAQLQLVISDLPVYDGLSLGDVFLVDVTHPHASNGPEKFSKFEVEVLS